VPVHFKLDHFCSLQQLLSLAITLGCNQHLSSSPTQRLRTRTCLASAAAAARERASSTSLFSASDRGFFLSVPKASGQHDEHTAPCSTASAAPLAGGAAIFLLMGLSFGLLLLPSLLESQARGCNPVSRAACRTCLRATFQLSARSSCLPEPSALAAASSAELLPLLCVSFTRGASQGFRLSRAVLLPAVLLWASHCPPASGGLQVEAGAPFPARRRASKRARRVRIAPSLIDGCRRHAEGDTSAPAAVCFSKAVGGCRVASKKEAVVGFFRCSSGDTLLESSVLS